MPVSYPIITTSSPVTIVSANPNITYAQIVASQAESFFYKVRKMYYRTDNGNQRNESFQIIRTETNGDQKVFVKLFLTPVYASPNVFVSIVDFVKDKINEIHLDGRTGIYFNIHAYTNITLSFQVWQLDFRKKNEDV